MASAEEPTRGRGSWPRVGGRLPVVGAFGGALRDTSMCAAHAQAFDMKEAATPFVWLLRSVLVSDIGYISER